MKITYISRRAHLPRRDWCADMPAVSLVQPDLSAHQPPPLSLEKLRIPSSTIRDLGHIRYLFDQRHSVGAI